MLNIVAEGGRRSESEKEMCHYVIRWRTEAQAKEHKQPLEAGKGKETKSPPELSEEHRVADALVLALWNVPWTWTSRTV